MIFESIAQRVIRELKEQGRVTELSQEATYNLDHKLAIGLKPIKEESEQKQRASWAYINDLESGRLNFYKK